MKRTKYSFLISGVLILIVSMGIGRFAYTPMLPLMQNDNDFSDKIAGFLASSNYLGYLLGALLAGNKLLKNYRLHLIKAFLVCSVLTTIGIGLTQSIPLWNLLRFLSGFSSAYVLVLTSGFVLEQLMILNKSHWTGIFYGGVGTGIFLSSLLIPIFNQFYGWNGAWIGLGVSSVFMAIFAWRGLQNTKLTIVHQEKKETTLNIPPEKWILWLTVAYGLEGLGYIVTGTFIVAIAETSPAFTIEASRVWLIAGLAAVPSCIGWSRYAKKKGYVFALVLAFLLQAIGIIIPVFWNSLIGISISGALFGATFMGITSLATTLGQKINPEKSQRTISGLTGIYAMGQLIGPLAAGYLTSIYNSYDIALIMASGVVGLGSLFLMSGLKYEKQILVQKNQ